jgi:predicted RNA-binding Zn ribbon-like protein
MGAEVTQVTIGSDDAVARLRFDAGRACLNLLATIGQRGCQPIERVPDPAGLADWLVAAGLCGTPPAVDTAGLAAMRELRTAAWEVLAAARAGHPLPAGPLEVINTHAACPTPVPQLSTDGWCVHRSTAPVQAALALLARDVIDLATGDDLARLRECANPRCRMLFCDASRGGRRRWCSMARCGNRAKARAHATRHQNPPPAAPR